MRWIGVILAVSLMAGAARAQPGCTTYIPPVTLMAGGPLYIQDSAGWSIAAYGNRVAVGDPFYASSASSPQGWIYVYRQNATGAWVREASLWGDTQAGFNLRMYGSLIVGRAPFAGAAGAGGNGVSLFVYENQPTAQGVAHWVRLGLVQPQYTTNRGQAYDRGMDFDGTRLAVTNAVASVHGFTSRIEVFEYDAAAPQRFTFSGSILDPLGPVVDAFGSKVAVDGDTIVVASPSANSFGSANPRVEVFQKIDGVWTFAQRWEDTLGYRDGVTFGIDVAVKGDTLAFSVGHDPNTPDVAGQPVAEVRVYRRVPAGQPGQPDQWALEQSMTLPGGTPTDGFGGSIALQPDRLLVGAPNQSLTGPNSGALHLYTRAGSVWTRQATLGRSDAPAARIGWSVAMTPDFIASGALGFAGRGAGLVFDQCAQPPPGDATPACLPGILGLYTFINSWMTGNMFADFNRNGALDVLDIFDYLSAWFNGCP